MVGRSSDLRKDKFRPNEGDEKVLEDEIPYPSAICALLYLTQYTRPYITFSMNLLARFSSAPTQRHWNGIRSIFQYLKGTIDLGPFFPYREAKGTADGTINSKVNVDAEKVTPYIETPNDV